MLNWLVRKETVILQWSLEFSNARFIELLFKIAEIHIWIFRYEQLR